MHHMQFIHLIINALLFQIWIYCFSWEIQFNHQQKNKDPNIRRKAKSTDMLKSIKNAFLAIDRGRTHPDVTTKKSMKFQGFLM